MRLEASDVVVIGGGAIGTAVAYYLAEIGRASCRERVFGLV